MTITMGYQSSQRTRAGTHNVVQLIRHYLMSIGAGDTVPVILLLRTKSPR